MNFRKYLPYRNYLLKTKLSVEEVKLRIMENIQPIQNFSLFKSQVPKKKYEGAIFGNTFKINQIIVSKQNQYTPIITGIIKTRFKSTSIEITMELQPLILSLTLFFMAFVGFACFMLLLSGFFHFNQMLKEGFNFMLLIPFVMLILGLLFTSLGFQREARNARQVLMELLNGEEEL